MAHPSRILSHIILKATSSFESSLRGLQWDFIGKRGKILGVQIQ